MLNRYILCRKLSIIKYTIFNSLLFFFACDDFLSLTKDVDSSKLGSLVANTQIVVNSLISPQDDTLRVSLTNSVPHIGLEKPFLPIKNAIIRLSNGANTITLPYNNLENTYLIEATKLPIIENKTYFLHIRTNNGEEVTSFCTVPKINKTLENSIETNIQQDEWIIRITWTDDPGEKNYYSFGGRYSTTYSQVSSRFLMSFAINLSTREEMPYERLITDNNRNGEILRTNLYYNLINNAFLMGEDYKVIHESIQTYLLVTDENYYRYFFSIAEISDDENPFQEPIPAYSNISGGIGIFAAFQVYRKITTF